MTLVELAPEQRRVLGVLLDRTWPQVNLVGTIQYFGIAEGDSSVMSAADAWDDLYIMAGKYRPQPVGTPGRPAA
jgi:hypothetical protein